MNGKERFALVTYTIVLTLLQPVLAVYLLWRARKQREYLQGWPQRFLAQVPKGHKGLASTRRIWVHAVSVGETHAISPLVRKWAEVYPDDVWVVSSTTPTGHATAKQVFAGLKGIRFFYLPYDLPWLNHRALKRLAADHLWLVETELWPNLLRQAKAAGLQTALINARISPNTGKRLEQLRWLSQPAIAKLDHLACQTEQDAEVFSKLGRKADVISGNLKFDVSLRPDLVELGKGWKDSMQVDSILVFASSREGEEERLLDAMVRAQFFKRLPKVSVWIVPRHPQRCDQVFEDMRTASARLGVAFPVRRSSWKEDRFSASAQLVLGDSMGEMPAYYSVADVALLGGSWEPLGGQNLIEACAYGCPVWLGPHTFNFAKAAEDSLVAGAARRFQDLAEAVRFFLDNDGKIPEAQGKAAIDFAQSHAGATAKTLGMLVDQEVSG